MSSLLAISDYLKDEIDNRLLFLDSPNLLTGSTRGASTFQPGARSGQTGELGDISGKTTITPRFAGITPPTSILWMLSPATELDPNAAQPLTTTGTDLSLQILAGQPGLHALLASASGAQGLTQIGGVLVSIPWFFAVSIDASFDTAVADLALDRSNIVRRTRLICHHALRAVNVRLVWKSAPFNEVMPPQFSPGFTLPPDTILSGVTVMPGNTPIAPGALPLPWFDIALKAQATSIAERHGGHFLVSGSTLDSGPMFETFADVRRLSRQQSSGTDGKKAFDRFEEELIARYLGTGLARKVLSLIGVPVVNNASGDVARDLMGAELYSAEHAEENVLGAVKFLQSSSLENIGLYYDWVKSKASDAGLNYDYEPDTADVPLTALNVLAGATCPDSLAAMQAIAPLDSNALGQARADARALGRTTLREGAPRHKKTGTRLIKAQPLQILEDSADGKFRKVRTLSSPVIEGWVAAKGIASFFRDSPTGLNVTLTPSQAITVKGDWTSQKKKLAATYNRLGGLMSVLAEELGVKLSVVLAVWYVESAGRKHVVDKAVIRFENHKLWDLWVKPVRRAADKAGATQAQRDLATRTEQSFSDHFQFCGNGVTINSGIKICGQKCVKKRRSWCQRFREVASSTTEFICQHGNQTREYKVLALAESLANKETAIKSISIGGPQILGTNHALVGYPSATEFYDAFQSSERMQVLGFFDYCKFKLKNERVLDYIKNRDYHNFAGAYNGKGRNQSKYCKAIRDRCNDAEAVLAELSAAGTAKPIPDVTPCP